MIEIGWARADKPGTRVVVGMSGGVDSSVTALLLQEQGYEVHGLFMRNWEDDDTNSYCAAAEDMHDAKLVCAELEIPLHHVNFARQYRERVFAHFLREYRAGRTPNPDVLCNQEIKFGAFLSYARRLGAQVIATGHYARTRVGPNQRVELLQGADPSKDQSYFLHRLSQAQLTPARFPLGGLLKSEVRKLAEDGGLHNFERKDSTGICFIGERHFREFLGKYLEKCPGPMCTPEGKFMGTHMGLMFYTLGQRQGLGIGGQPDADQQPWYVADKILEDNTLIVVQGSRHPLLFQDTLSADRLHWVTGCAPRVGVALRARIRHLQREEPCHIADTDHHDCIVHFERPQRAVTPGQAVVFYDDEECLGGGIIQRAWSRSAAPELTLRPGATG